MYSLVELYHICIAVLKLKFIVIFPKQEDTEVLGSMY